MRGFPLSVLLGIELQADTISLQGVDRRGQRLAYVEETVSVPFHRFWEVHPDERVRSVRALLLHALQEGLIRPGTIAAIGISCEPGLVLVDSEMEPVPPRALNWNEIEAQNASPNKILTESLEKYPAVARNLSAVLDLQDWLRYRWTGAVATTRSFAWSSGLTRETSPGEHWDASALERIGLGSGQMPPVLPGPHRIGTIQEELVRETGLARGTWFCGGTEPRAARLWLAAEPREGVGIVLLEEQGATLWRVAGAPVGTTSIEDAIPSPQGDHWYYREAVEVADPRNGDTPIADVIHDANCIDTQQQWSGDLDAMMVSADFGSPSRAPALLAGIGLGWYRDLRPLWRKRCPAQSHQQWNDQRIASQQSSDQKTREKT